MKVITVCGSLKFKNEIIRTAIKAELAGNVVLTTIIPINDDKDVYTDEEIAMLGRMHKEKIKLSDAVLIVNVNGYIGNSTESEIEFAKALDKEIIYYSDLINSDGRYGFL